MRITRREFLAGLLATAACSSGGDDDAVPTTTTAATAPAPTTTTAPPEPIGPDPFTLGVASGDPDSTSVALWTRLLPADGDIDVSWEVLDDDDRVVTSGDATAEARLGHSVHVVADTLEPATTYRYRFTVPSTNHVSPVGTTRTAPPEGDETPVSLAVTSCQRYDDGHWAAHRDIAAADVDLVVFLGDYIYESAQREQPVRPLPSMPDVVTDLAGYRSRYEAARADPDLAAAHAAHPWVVTWDDHEVENNHAGGAGVVDPARRAAAYQAWWEHMPVRFGPPDGARLDIHRSLPWGSLLELLVLDTRQHRVAPPCGGGIVDTNACAEVGAPDRTVLGAEQEAWLLDRLANTEAAWTTLAQSVVFAPINVGGQVNSDAWDGYPAARATIVDALAGHDTVVLTGDIHVQMIVNVLDDAGAVVAAELVTPSISSQVGAAGAITEVLPSVAPQVLHADAERRGWMRCDVTADRWVATYREVLDVTDPASDVVDGASFEVVRGTPGASPR
jgi:alkaline phosphatase D